MSDVDYLEMNRTGWDRRARAHIDSAFYDVEGFLAGKSSLREIELAELGDVRHRSPLHLQCHFGLDTLSWARLGAVCTGVDISPVAIQQARDLARQTALGATFVCSDVYGFGRQQAEPFDIVLHPRSARRGRPGNLYGARCWSTAFWVDASASDAAVPNVSLGQIRRIRVAASRYGVRCGETAHGECLWYTV